MEFKGITNLMADLEEEKLMVFVDEFLALDPSREEGLGVIEACRRGTEKVGTLFEAGEYFLKRSKSGWNLWSAAKWMT